MADTLDSSTCDVFFRRTWFSPLHERKQHRRTSQRAAGSGSSLSARLPVCGCAEQRQSEHAPVALQARPRVEEQLALWPDSEDQRREELSAVPADHHCLDLHRRGAAGATGLSIVLGLLVLLLVLLAHPAARGALALRS